MKTKINWILRQTHDKWQHTTRRGEFRIILESIAEQTPDNFNELYDYLVREHKKGTLLMMTGIIILLDRTLTKELQIALKEANIYRINNKQNEQDR